MNLKTIVPLVLALVLGVIAAKLGKDVIGRNRGAAGASVKLTKLVVAAEDLAPGSTIKAADVVLKDMPADAAASGFTFTAPDEVVGRVVTTQLVKGQSVLGTLLAPVGVSGPGALVPEGMRAVTLEVNEFSGVAGLLIPGSRVDVVQTIKPKGDDEALMAKTIVENLRVLAVGRRMGTAAPAPGEPEVLARSITLLVTAEQAEAIDLASHVGSPRLVLRNGADAKLTQGKGVTVATLRGAPETAETDPLKEVLTQLLLGGNGGGPATRPAVTVRDEAPKPKDYRDVEVIRGGASTSVRVGKPADNALTGGADKLLGEIPQDR